MPILHVCVYFCSLDRSECVHCVNKLMCLYDTTKYVSIARMSVLRLCVENGGMGACARFCSKM